MTKKRERVFALSLALLFLVTSVGLTIYTIWEAHISSQSSNSNGSTKLAGTQLSNFTPVNAIDHLEQQDLSPGNGQAVKPGDTITVNYTGAVAASGVIFQSSLDSGQLATLSLNNVIKGWSLGIPGMKLGGTRRLLIPAALAYGANPPAGSGIPVNADLVFDITLVKIN